MSIVPFVYSKRAAAARSLVSRYRRSNVLSPLRPDHSWNYPGMLLALHLWSAKPRNANFSSPYAPIPFPLLPQKPHGIKITLYSTQTPLSPETVHEKAYNERNKTWRHSTSSQACAAMHTTHSVSHAAPTHRLSPWPLGSLRLSHSHTHPPHRPEPRPPPAPRPAQGNSYICTTWVIGLRLGTGS